MPQIGSIGSAVSIELRLVTDTDRHRAMASTRTRKNEVISSGVARIWCEEGHKMTSK